MWTNLPSVRAARVCRPYGFNGTVCENKTVPLIRHLLRKCHLPLKGKALGRLIAAPVFARVCRNARRARRPRRARGPLLGLRPPGHQASPPVGAAALGGPRETERLHNQGRSPHPSRLRRATFPLGGGRLFAPGALTRQTQAQKRDRTKASLVKGRADSPYQGEMSQRDKRDGDDRRRRWRDSESRKLSAQRNPPPGFAGSPPTPFVATRHLPLTGGVGLSQGSRPFTRGPGGASPSPTK